MDSADAASGGGARARRPAHRGDRTDHERPGGDRGVHPARGQGRSVRDRRSSRRTASGRSGRATIWPRLVRRRGGRATRTGRCRPATSSSSPPRSSARPRTAGAPAAATRGGHPSRDGARRSRAGAPTAIVRTASGSDAGGGRGRQLQRRPRRGAAAAGRPRRERRAAAGAARASAVGGPVGVIISDTAGRAVADRVRPTRPSARPAFGCWSTTSGDATRTATSSQVTARAVADELAGGRRPGQGEAGRATGRRRPWTAGSVDLEADAGRRRRSRPPAAEDMFARGTREAVLAAVCAATGSVGRVRAVLRAGGRRSWSTAVLAGSGRTGGEAALLRAVLAALGVPSPRERRIEPFGIDSPGSCVDPSGARAPSR